MVTFECTVQEGHCDEALKPALIRSLERICKDLLGPKGHPVEVSWVVVKKGFGFRGGVPSTTSQVRGRIPDGCDDDTRRRLLTTIGETWCQVTGASAHELVVSARDQSWPG